MNDEKIILNYTFESLTQKLTESIFRESVKKMKKTTKDNPRQYGNVLFWVEEKENKTILMYTKHPKEWNINEVIIDLENEEKAFLESTGIIFNTEYKFNDMLSF